MQDKPVPDDLKRNLLNIISNHIDINRYQVFLFGSRAANKEHNRSDFDIGIEGPEEVPASVLATIEEEIEKLDTLYTIQIVDFKRVSPKFYQVAKQHNYFLTASPQ